MHIYYYLYHFSPFNVTSTELTIWYLSTNSVFFFGEDQLSHSQHYPVYKHGICYI